MTHNMPLSIAMPCVRGVLPGPGMLRTISPVSGSIRNTLFAAGTAIQYLPSSHFKPCAPDGVSPRSALMRP